MTTPTPASTEPSESKAEYRVRNWSDYDRALVQRGSLTVWFDEAYVREHWIPAGTGKRGAPWVYSDLAIQLLLVLKAVFHLPYRALEGLARSLMQLLGLDLPVPDHTHLSRRARTLQVTIPRRAREEPLHVVVDSTGLKIFGEGEWKVRQHGVGKCRTWRKVHLAVDAQGKDVIGVEVTTVEWTDAEVFDGLIEQIEGPIAQIDADGATIPARFTRRVRSGGRRSWSLPERMRCRGKPSIRGPKPWRRLPSRAWRGGKRPRAIIAAASPKMPCIA